MVPAAIAFARLLSIALREPLRDRMAFVWGLSQPLFAMGCVALSSGRLALDVAAVASYGLYVCFVNSLYATGATLLWKRESGVLRGLAREPTQRARLVLVHVIAAAVHSLIFCSALLALISSINEFRPSLLDDVRIVAAGLVASIAASVGSLIVLRFRLSSANCAAVMNVCTFLLALLTFFVKPSTPQLAALQSFNPVTLWSSLLYQPTAYSPNASAPLICALWGLMLLGAGAYGLSGFRLRPTICR